jgi:hypothetical protein
LGEKEAGVGAMAEKMKEMENKPERFGNMGENL